MTTYADMILGAREACKATYVRGGGSPRDHWLVEAKGPTAYMGRKIANVYDVTTGSYQAGVIWTLGLPALPLDARLSKAEGEQVTGYWLHENDHALFTDYAVWDVAVREGLARIVNGLEDPRIEREGTRNNIAAGHADLINKLATTLVLKALSEGWSARDVDNLPFTLAIYGRVALSGLSVPGLLPYRAVLSADDADLLDEAFARLDRARPGRDGTADVLDIARWLMAQIKGRQPVQPPVNPGRKPRPPVEGEGEGQDGEGEGEDDGEGDEGEGDAEGPGEGEDGDDGEDGPRGPTKRGTDADDAPKGEDDGEDGEGEGDDGEDDQPAPGEGGTEAGTGGSWSAPDPSKMKDAEPDLGDLARQIEARAGKADKGDRVLSSFINVPAVDLGPMAQDVTKNARGHFVATPKSSKEHTADSWLRSAGNTSRLRNDIARLVKAPERVGKLHSQTMGRFDARRLPAALCGNSNVFTRRQDDPGVETAVYIALDVSGSMDGVPAIAAGTLALAMGDALNNAAVPFCVAGFADPDARVVSHNGMGTTMLQAKPFKAAWKQRRGSVVALMRGYCQSGTHIAPAIRQGTLELKAVKSASRRILFILTDGQDGHASEAATKAVKLAKIEGVEVVGLGIGVELDRETYGDLRVTVTSVSEIATKGLGLLVKALERGR